MTHILIVEDNIEVLESTAELLELEGFKITTATNGKEGLDQIIRDIPDVIICDIVMPEMDGLELLEELDKRPEFSTILFIFFSAKSEKGDIRNGIDMGADDYLTKPFELEDLLQSIENSLQKRKNLVKRYKSTGALTAKISKQSANYTKTFPQK